MANEMGNQALDTPANESKEAYKIIAYSGSKLPGALLNVVRAPFLNSLRYGNDLFKLIDKDAYYKTYSQYVDSLLNRPKSLVRLSVLDDGTVLGWSLSEGDVLHFVWVKKEVRRQGIGRALIPDNISTFSHVTNKGLSIWSSKCAAWKFNPFI